MKACVTGYCVVNITVDGRNYKDFRFNVMKDLYSDIILGYDFQNMHKRLIIELSGSRADLVIENNTTPCALSAATVGEPSLFANLLPNCKPIATKPRRFGLQDREFIQSEVNHLLAEGIIEAVHLRGVHKLLLSRVQENKDSVLTTHKLSTSTQNLMHIRSHALTT